MEGSRSEGAFGWRDQWPAPSQRVDEVAVFFEDVSLREHVNRRFEKYEWSGGEARVLSRRKMRPIISAVYD